MKQHDTPEGLVFVLPQLLDTVKAQEIEMDLHKAAEAAETKVVFDFQDVTYISSYFMRICLNTAKKTTENGFEMVNVKSEIKKVFMIAGFDKYFNIK